MQRLPLLIFICALSVPHLWLSRCVAQPASRPAIADPRHIANGHLIPSEGYADQPYIVRTDDGAWLCVITTGKGVEGAPGQHVISMRSSDRGRTWSKPVDVEPADGPEASYAVLLKVPGGRIYCFYNYNADNLREVKRIDGGVYKRVDSLGQYVFKFSDDHGKTWSARRYPIAVREFQCDRDNVYGGKVRFFWNVGRPTIHGDAALLTLHKVGAMGPGFFAQSEGAFLRSTNLLTERDPEKITFTTLPDGDVGLRTPAASGLQPAGGKIAEEQCVVPLSDGSLYCVYRSVDGYPVCAYSRDGGRTWTPPAYKTYWPGGPRFKHPRAANFVWKCANGKYLYWFHNHGGAVAAKSPGWNPYNDRNPAWLCAGEERDTPDGRRIFWTQPEILLYDDDPLIRMSYPDLVEEDGKFFITETQKHIARLHEVSPALVEGLFKQFENHGIAKAGLVLDAPASGEAALAAGRSVKMPRLSDFRAVDNAAHDMRSKDLRSGFTLDLSLKLDSLDAGAVLLDWTDALGRGGKLIAAGDGAVELRLGDGRQTAAWTSDRGRLAAGKTHHVSVIVDGGPKIIVFVIDGVLCDGGEERQFGWGRFSPTLRSPNGAGEIKIAPQVRGLRVYSRALRVSEVVGNAKAGK